MRILLVGAGGVGDAIAKIAARRDFFEVIVVSDYDVSRAEKTIAWGKKIVEFRADVTVTAIRKALAPPER